MAEYHAELLDAAQRLLARRAGQKGQLPSARIRRSISTSYYALFHFLVDEASRARIGSHNDLRRRRRIFARVVTHKGIKVALDKVRGASVDGSVADFLRPRGQTAGTVAPPAFAKTMADAFSDAQAKRHDADYDLNKPLNRLDAVLLIARVRRAIKAWQSAKFPRVEPSNPQSGFPLSVDQIVLAEQLADRVHPLSPPLDDAPHPSGLPAELIGGRTLLVGFRCVPGSRAHGDDLAPGAVMLDHRPAATGDPQIDSQRSIFANSQGRPPKVAHQALTPWLYLRQAKLGSR
jgi:hypothetical protein